MIKMAVVLLALLSGNAFASAGGGGETDIFHRTVNFAIFAAILYYLIADHVKSFFQERSQKIADELEEVQRKLQETKDKKEEALEKVKEAEKKAEEILAIAKKENEIINNKIAESVAADIKILEAQYEEKVSLETNKVRRDVVEEVMVDVLQGDAIDVKNSQLKDIIKKKAA
jgi:F-type H+-transporting ATPase subunit b